jgi:hypothetical protein
MRRALSALIPLLLACGTTAPLGAQAVRGRVVEQGSELPVRGAFITLLDDEGKRQGATLADSLGNFFIRAPGAGRYTLRTHRIGHQTTTTPILELGKGETLSYRIEAPIAPIVLEEVSAAARSRCDLPRELGAETQLLWDEARKAISIVAWLGRGRGVPYQGFAYERTRRVLSREIEEQRAWLYSGYGRSPFSSEAAGDLAKHGYVRVLDVDHYQYYGLDATELLSDSFLETHCFRVRDAGPGEESMIGLGFEPIPSHTLPDITGALWLNRATFELRFLDFTFTRHPYAFPVPSGPFGGRVEFRRLDNGAWIVERWSLRMPQFPVDISLPPTTVNDRRIESARDSLIMLQRFGLQIREVGGEIRYIADPGPAAEGLAAVEGVVFDSTRAAPLAGASVFLNRGGPVARTGIDGTFRMIGLPAGHHEIAFVHPYADSLGLVVRPRPIVLTNGEFARAELFIPRGEGCPVRSDVGEGAGGAGAGTGVGTDVVGTGAGTGMGIVAGVVYDGATGGAVADARAIVEVAGGDDRGMWVMHDGLPELLTGEDGRFLFCVQPTGKKLRLQVIRGRRRATAQLRVAAPGLILRDFVLR